jgi:hypothetical protein
VGFSAFLPPGLACRATEATHGLRADKPIELLGTQQLFLEHDLSHTLFFLARAPRYPGHELIAENRQKGRCRHRGDLDVSPALLFVGLDTFNTEPA